MPPVVDAGRLAGHLAAGFGERSLQYGMLLLFAAVLACYLVSLVLTLLGDGLD